MDQKLKKKRGENWTAEEKDLLRQLIAQSANILEDKSTKTNTIIQKSKEWKIVTNKLNEITGKMRTDGELKLAWKRMKLTAKANISAHRRQQSQTGGGKKPPSPSPEDLEIMSIAPHDFVVVINDYDSDAVIPDTIQSPEVIVIEAKPGPSNEGNEGNYDVNLLISATDVDKTVTNEDTKEPVTNACNINIVNNTKSHKRKKTSQIRIDQGRQAIINSNLDFKNRQLEMLELEHTNNLKISQLKIKKLQLQIELLETQIKKEKENCNQ